MKPNSRSFVSVRSWARVGVFVLGIWCVPHGARSAETWLTPEGAEEVPWGGLQKPAKYERMPRSLLLADYGYAGRGPADRPEDLEVWDSTRSGERRFVRYVDGALVDAWLLRPGPIDDTYYSIHGVEELRGAVLGPAEPGWVAVGDAISWKLDGRTVLHWRDRLTDNEILASRAIPGTRYSARRPKPLAPGEPSSAKAAISGELKKMAKAYEGILSACFDSATKPVRAEVSVKYDRLGRLARLRVDTDSVTYDVEVCVAGAMVRTGAAPGMEGSFTVFRNK